MAKANLLTLDQIARLLGVTYWTARGFLARGELRKLKIGGRVYVPREEAERLLKKIMAGAGKK